MFHTVRSLIAETALQGKRKRVLATLLFTRTKKTNTFKNVGKTHKNKQNAKKSTKIRFDMSGVVTF